MENNPKTERIIKVLDSLCDILDLGQSEHSTEKLFHILSNAFDDINVFKMSSALSQAHENGLYFDMRGLIADAVLNECELFNKK